MYMYIAKCKNVDMTKNPIIVIKKINNICYVGKTLFSCKSIVSLLHFWDNNTNHLMKAGLIQLVKKLILKCHLI